MNESSDDPPLIDRIDHWLHPKTRGDDKGSSREQDICSVARHSSADNGTADVPGRVNADAHHAKKETSSNPPPPNTSSIQPGHPPDTPDNGQGDASLESSEKSPWYSRLYSNSRQIILSSWINCLLVFVPAGIVLGAIGRSKGEDSPVSPTVVFAINAIAIIPLAGLLSFATESVASRLGDKIGALLNVTFGNAVELIILYVFFLVLNTVSLDIY